MEESLHAVVALIVLTIIYKRMIDRRVQGPIGWLQALLPVGLGGVSLPLSFTFFLGVGVLINQIDLGSYPLPPFLKSVRAGFFLAGLPEELAKGIAILVALLFLRKKLTSVYDYILMGMAVGFGFTVFEEFLYGANPMRLPLIALHGVFSGTFAYFLGMAAYHKKTQQGSVVIDVILGIVLPILMHSLYDGCTVSNTMLYSDDPKVQDLGIIIGIVGMVVSVIVQVYVLLKIKKDSEKLCGMAL